MPSACCSRFRFARAILFQIWTLNRSKQNKYWCGSPFTPALTRLLSLLDFLFSDTEKRKSIFELVWAKKWSCEKLIMWKLTTSLSDQLAWLMFIVGAHIQMVVSPKKHKYYRVNRKFFSEWIWQCSTEKRLTEDIVAPRCGGYEHWDIGISKYWFHYKLYRFSSHVSMLPTPFYSFACFRTCFRGRSGPRKLLIKVTHGHGNREAPICIYIYLEKK